jgi:hypothetical protein
MKEPQMPRKRKTAREQTTEEAIRKLFPNKVVKSVKKDAEKAANRPHKKHPK